MGKPTAQSLAAALWALRCYRRSAAVVVATGAVGIAVATAVLGLAPRLRVAPVRETDWSLAWSALAFGPVAAQRDAMAGVAQVLRAAVVALVAVTALSVVATSVARAFARRGDVAVRRAVGASRHTLAAAALVEGIALALGAVLAGVAGAAAAGPALEAAWPGLLARESAPVARLAVAAVALLVIAGALLVLGQARRGTLVPQTGPSTVPLFVPALQFGLGLIVLAAAAQLSRWGGAIADPEVQPPAPGHVQPVGAPHVPRAERGERYGALEARLRGALPGALVSLTSPGTLSGLGVVDVDVTECGRCYQGGIAVPMRPVQVAHHLVSPDSFRAMGLRLTEGRGVAGADRFEAHRVAVVSRSLARGHFESGRAVGRAIRVGASGTWYTIVGVVEDRVAAALGGGSQPPEAVYLSVFQHPAATLDLLVRPAARGPDVRRIAAAAVRAVLGASGAVAVPEALLRAADAAPRRWVSRVLGAVGWATVGVGVLGMLAVMRMWVAGVLPELALRRAMGARRYHVLGRVGARAAGVSAGGVAIAWWLGPILSDLVARTMAGVPPWNLGHVLVPALVLMTATLAGAVVPAWTAVSAAPAAARTRVDELG